MPDRVSRAHLLVFLQELAVKFKKPGMIADIVCPRVPVKKQADKYRIWGKDRFINRGSGINWQPGTAPGEIEMRWSADQYFTPLYKLRTRLTDQERRNADSDLDLEGNATEYVTEALEIGREARVAALFTAPGNYGATHKIAKAGGSEYDQAAVASTDQVVKDIDALVSVIKQDAICTSGDLTVVIPDPVFDLGVKRNAGLLEKIKYTQTGVVTTDLIREILGVKQVLIASSLAAAPSVEKEGSDVVTGYSTSYLWGDTIWVGLVPENATNDLQPAFARTFWWREETGGQDRQVRQYRDGDEGKETDWIEVKEASGEKIQFPIAGGIITNCLSTL